MNILFVINNLYGGGAEKVLQTLVSNLCERNYNITLYSVIDEELDTKVYPSKLSYKSIFKNVPDHCHPLKAFYIKLLNKLKLLIFHHLSPQIFYKLFIGGNYDVEVAFIEGYSTKIVSGSINKKSIKLAWVHIDLSENPWSRIAYRSLAQEINIYKTFDRIVCVSESVRKGFLKRFEEFDSLTVKYNPIDSEEIITSSEQPANMKISNKPFLISIGRLEDQKGYDRLLEVIKRLKNNNISVHLKILGEGSKRKELEAFINDNQLEDHVELLGYVDNPYPYLKNAQLYVASSRTEGFSTVVSEALVLGKPVLATNCAGMNELLGASEFGLITENSTEGIFKGIQEILLNKALLERYVIQSEIRGKQFKLESSVLEIEKLWSHE
ncbi:glycosyltransferase [Robertkochia marina]|uniref:Glycosyltransferase n=1 Tax=Robertkochia marina TaxID=1227945 RepID=A0A4S3LZP7_9FLAO|nr:glycosyltransferase [Robertkochia marina]THD66785.1 glycosyltransferase [Robertkochia marina]TRZ41924.1 glycosyltransferase [Robertkochia marina]